MNDANSRKPTTSSASPCLTPQTRLDELRDEEWVRNDAASNPNSHALELYDADHSGQHDTSQPRPSIPPFMVYPPPPPPPISVTEMSIPPPPPPPPPMPLPNGGYSGMISTTPRSASLDKLDHEQESLRDLRDKLVGARFSIAAKRSELRDIHIEAGAKDGHVFNLLRQYLNEIHVDLPQNIQESLSDASSSRDRLGLLEVEYDEAEVSYNALEWNYSRRETRFVERLLNSKLVPSDTIDRSRSADNLEIVHLTNSMTHSIEDESMSWNHTCFTDEPDPRYTTHLPIDRGRLDVVTTDTPTLGHRQPSPHRLTPIQSDDESRIHSIYPHLRWLERTRRIDAWLLEMVNSSSVQQESLRTINDFGFSDKSTWWEHTKWLLIQDYRPEFHTGDSIASKQVTGRDTCMSDINASNSNTALLEHRIADTVEVGFHPSDVPSPPTASSMIQTSELHNAIDDAKASRDDSKISCSEAASSTSTSLVFTHSVPSRIAVAGSEAIPGYDLIVDAYTRSPSMIDASIPVDRAAFNHGMKPTSPDTAPVAPYQSVAGDMRPTLNHFQQLYNPLQVRKPETARATTLPIKSHSAAPLLPRSSLPPVTSINNPKQFRRQSSEKTSGPPRQRLVFKRSSSSVTSSRVSSPRNDPVSPARNFTDRCLVM